MLGACYSGLVGTAELHFHSSFQGYPTCLFLSHTAWWPDGHFGHIWPFMAIWPSGQPVLSSREFMLLMYDALSVSTSFPVWGSGRVGPQIRILTARISSVYKNPSLGSRQSEPQTRKVDYPSKKDNFSGLKSGNWFQFFFRTHETCWECVFCKKQHLIWSSFA